MRNIQQIEDVLLLHYLLTITPMGTHWCVNININTK